MPGILIEATWDDTGEIDRITFLAEVKDGKQVITQTLPKLRSKLDALGAPVRASRSAADRCAGGASHSAGGMVRLAP